MKKTRILKNTKKLWKNYKKTTKKLPKKQFFPKEYNLSAIDNRMGSK